MSFDPTRLKKGLLAVMSTAAAIYIFETSRFYFFSAGGNDGHYTFEISTDLSKRYSDRHPELGMVGIETSGDQRLRVRDNQLISFTKVSMHGPFRNVPAQSPHLNGAPNVIFTGCSFVFGLGLNDEDTIANQFKILNSKENVFNLSMSGWGTHQIRWLAEHGWLSPKPDNDLGGYVLYGYISDHFTRNTQSLLAMSYIDFEADTPSYRIKEGHLNYEGPFRKAHPYLTQIQEKILRSSTVSQLFLKYGWLDWSQDDATELLCSLLNSTEQDLAKKHFKLVVFNYPMQPYPKKMKACLSKSIRVFDYSDEYEAEEKAHLLRIHDIDSHPSKYLNELIAQRLTADLKTQKQ